MSSITNNIEIEVQEIAEQLTNWRRYLHQNPELSNREWQTAEWLKSQLKKLDVVEIIEYQGLPGFVVTISGESSEELAFRADMDALPLNEGKLDCTYASQAAGVTHACGHDAHMAILLGLAHVLAMRKKAGNLNKSVRLIFQHSEEQVPGGAREMIAAGALGKATKIFALHVWAALETGKIGIKAGVMMAAADRFIIELQGKGGHGSMPHQTIDTVLLASQLVLQLQTIVSRSVRPFDSAVLSVGTINAGSNFNIIADNAKLTGTVRSYNNQVRDLIRQRIKEIVEGLCLASGGADYKLNYIEGYPPVYNDEQLTESTIKNLQSIYDEENVHIIEPVMGGEDFAYYQKEVPGVLFFVGAANRDLGITYPQHHPKFDIDERALAIGLNSLLKLYETS